MDIYAKLDPQRFPDMSLPMAAILGFVPDRPIHGGTCIVDRAPHAELREETTPDDVLAERDDADLRAFIAELIILGAPMPAVGVGIAAAGRALLEVAWEAQKLGVALDLAAQDLADFKAAGWDIVVVAAHASEDARAAFERLRQALRLTADVDRPAEDGTDEPPGPAGRSRGERR